MSPSVNRVDLVGRIGHEPDMRYLESGQCLTRFRLATDRPARAGGEPQEPQTDWHQVVCWGQMAEFAGNYLTVGRLVYVSGRLAYDLYEGRDGLRHRTVEIVAREVVPLDRPPPRQAPDEAADEAEESGQETDPEPRPAPPSPPPAPIPQPDARGPRQPTAATGRARPARR